MNDRRQNIYLERAENHFYRGEYREAMRLYGILLKDFPDLKEERNEEAEEIIEAMIGSLDDALEKISELLEGTFLAKEETMDGITYADFKELVTLRGSFRRAFEDIMFSTRVVITDKEELFDFIRSLVDNGFDEMALQYIEGAAAAFPGEEKLDELIDKLKGDA